MLSIVEGLTKRRYFASVCMVILLTSTAVLAILLTDRIYSLILTADM
jgi:hypothetical protein